MFIYTALPIFRNHFDCEKIVDESRVVIWRNIKSFRKRLFSNAILSGSSLKRANTGESTRSFLVGWDTESSYMFFARKSANPATPAVIFPILTPTYKCK